MIREPILPNRGQRSEWNPDERCEEGRGHRQLDRGGEEDDQRAGHRALIQVRVRDAPVPMEEGGQIVHVLEWERLIKVERADHGRDLRSTVVLTWGCGVKCAECDR